MANRIDMNLHPKILSKKNVEKRHTHMAKSQDIRNVCMPRSLQLQNLQAHHDGTLPNVHISDCFGTNIN
jgi:hypothetical protein